MAAKRVAKPAKTTSRDSFYNTKSYNPIQSAASTVGKYFGNVKKEIKQYARGEARLQAAIYDAKTFPPADRPALRAKANKLREKSDKNFGQLAGAVFLNRKYDKKGRSK